TGSDGDRHTKARSLTEAALDVDAPLVQFTNRLRDSQTQATAAHLPRPRFVHPVKAIEAMGKRFRRNPGSRVRYFNDGLVGLVRNADTDRAAGRGVFNGVVNKIG